MKILILAKFIICKCSEFGQLKKKTVFGKGLDLPEQDKMAGEFQKAEMKKPL